MSTIVPKTVLPTLLLLLTLQCGLAQIDEREAYMTWLSVGLHKKLSAKVRLSYTQLHSLSLDTYRVNFIQSNLKLSVRLSDRIRAIGGVKPTFRINQVKGDQVVFHRAFAELQWHQKLGKHFRWRNSITAEHHFTGRNKFAQRYYLTSKVYYRNNNWPLRLRPFLTQKLYWYGGARPLQYYDTAGDKLALATSNGLHAYRWQLGAQVRPHKKITVTAYFMQQREFNTRLFGSRNINDVNPVSGKVRRRFYHFSTVGTAVSFSL